MLIKKKKDVILFIYMPRLFYKKSKSLEMDQ